MQSEPRSASRNQIVMLSLATRTALQIKSLGTSLHISTVCAQSTICAAAHIVDVERPSAVGCHRRTQRGRRCLVKRFEVDEKARAEFANLSGGEADAVFLFQSGADFLALAVVNKAFDADMDHDVVTDFAPGRNQFGKGCSTLSHKRAIFFASGGTHMHNLPHPKGAMGQSNRLALQGLLYIHGTLAERTSFSGFIGRDQHPGQNSHLSLIPVLQGPDLLLQNCERRERESAVFFTP